MRKLMQAVEACGAAMLRAAPLVAALWLVALPDAALAVPAFNRQTGQNCVACHAGGQFPELTPYGRLFKMTGYTIGERSVPLSAMAVVSSSRVSSTSTSPDPGADFQKNGSPAFATASLFIAGKVTDNIGVFAQITYDPFATQSTDNKFHGHTNADNIDIRYADRFIRPDHDLIFGLSANNNPSVSDPWNTAAAWMQYVPVPSPTSSRFIDGNAPYPGFGAGGNIAGVSAYAFLNQHFYAELGGYRSAKGVWSFMSAGLADRDVSRLKGVNPYWRLAYSHDWGAHSLMVGTSGMAADVYDDPLNTSDPSAVHRFNDRGIDAQYQYLLDPHAVTVQAAYMRNHVRYSGTPAVAAFVGRAGEALPDNNASDTNKVFRAKATYVYHAMYGGSVGVFNLTGTTNTANQSAGYDPEGSVGSFLSTDPVGDNLSGNPATRGMTYEAFWTPIQYLRLGTQYTAYSKFNGAKSNYNGLGRNASDNNTLFVYAWFAY